MSIVDRFVRRLCANSLEGLVREAVSAQAVSLLKDPLRQPLVYGDATRLHVHPSAVVNNALFNLSSGDITVGSLVLDDVAPYTVVAGSPATVRRTIPPPHDEQAQA